MREKSKDNSQQRLSLETRDLQQKTKAALSKISAVMAKKENPSQSLVNFLTGFVFGFSVSVGLGLTTVSCLVFGVMVASGVLVSRSFLVYLLTQTVVLALLALFSQVAFRLIPNFSIDPEDFFIGYLLIIFLSPLVSRLKSIKLASESFLVSNSVQLFTAVFFAALVQFLRSRMPSDANFAVTRMFEGEDNAGIVEILAGAIDNGFTPQAAQFGEFINSVYLAASGLILNLSESSNSGLLPALTHYNITLLLMAWVPIAALCSLALSGRKLRDSSAIAIIAVTSVLTSILFWPFVTLGHTSVISSGLFAMSLLALTLNNRFAAQHPIVLASLITALGLIIGTSWFPLMPLAAATVALSYLKLLQIEYRKGNVKIVLSLLAVFGFISLLLLPGVLNLALNSGSYIDLQGGTRTASVGLVILSLFLVAITGWRLLAIPKGHKSTEPGLFLLTLLMVVMSNAYLLVSGSSGNEGGFGYGATKYLLTTICFSLPVLWVFVLDYLKPANFAVISGLGIVLVLSVLMIQPDSRKVPVSIVAPQLTSWQFLAPPDLVTPDSGTSAIATALDLAFQADPDHVFCVSDYGVPAQPGEINFSSYFCNRWAGSINADKDSFMWGAVPIGVNAPESLSEFRNKYLGEEVVVVRTANPAEVTAPQLDVSETWWGKYVDESWEIIAVDW